MSNRVLEFHGTMYTQIIFYGVKECGVLSAKLFTLYIDNIFTELKQLGYGRHINHIYMGALSYYILLLIAKKCLYGSLVLRQMIM